jgi:hypothetical protein
MFQPSDLHSGWRSALHSLARSMGDEQTEAPERDPAPDGGDDSEREAFHLDDTELANRLIPDRGLIHYSTPPHARLMFPDMTQP